MTYTREQILSMQAGQVLDAVAAVVVFNHPNVRRLYSRYVYDNAGRDHLGNILSVMGTIDVEEYSTDISAAWTLMENPKVMDKFQLGLYPTSFGKWICRSFMPGYDINVQAETAPEAITKAAILAMMESGGTGE